MALPPIKEVETDAQVHRWDLTISLGAICALLVAIAAVTSWWVLLAPLIVFAASFAWRQLLRVYSLTVRGYYAMTVSTRSLRYEERAPFLVRSFTLQLEHTEPGQWELFVPNEEVWARTVPEWAQARRDEISTRIAHTWRFRDVNFTERAADA